MSTITLREYLSGVEELIEGGQADEAITHCRHILETFPKNVATYRLIGKAYLESRRYGDAADIFQRLLSSCPDDFVAHIGMSIIREDEDNQDAAIWHMERAFEAQPSNRAVQDELRRLYSLREGFAPPKVRLTRGALARMYAHGNLYNQAITELSNALNEDPQRPDLQVLLAEMYIHTDRQAEAIEICHQLIGKLPYCLYANHLMADILRQSHRDAEAVPYLKVVEELEPYAAHTSASQPASEVPADQVQLEHLVLEGAVSGSGDMPKSWTGALEPLAEDEPAFVKEDLPGWLEGGSEKTPPPPMEGEEAVVDQDADQPDSGLSGLQQDAPSDATIEEDSGALRAPTEEIPEWLRELRPSSTQKEPAPSGSAAAEDSPEADDLDWMKEFDEAGFETTRLPGEAAPPFEDMETPAAAGEPEAAAEEQRSDEPLSQEEEAEGLGWLEGLAARQGVSDEELLTPESERSDETPEWLDTPEKAKQSGSLAWLDEMAAEIDQQSAEQEPSGSLEQAAPQVEEDLPDFQAGEEGAKAEAGEEEAKAEAGEEEAKAEAKAEPADIPDWLKDLAEEAETGPLRTPQSETDSLQRPPEWLDELRPDSAAAEAQSAVEDEPAETPPVEEEQDPDWLAELSEEDAPEAPSASPAGAEEDHEIAGSGLKKDIADGEPVEGLAQAGAMDSAWVPESKVSGEKPAESAPSSTEGQKNGTPSLHAQLDQARQTLNRGNAEEAAGEYGKLVGRRLLLDEVISDLQAALSRHPDSVPLLQTLGDAYMRTNHLREALECYTRAEDLL